MAPVLADVAPEPSTAVVAGWVVACVACVALVVAVAVVVTVLVVRRNRTKPGG